MASAASVKSAGTKCKRQTDRQISFLSLEICLAAFSQPWESHQAINAWRLAQCALRPTFGGTEYAACYEGFLSIHGQGGKSYRNSTASDLSQYGSLGTD
jgi:hypothetical protein